MATTISSPRNSVITSLHTKADPSTLKTTRVDWLAEGIPQYAGRYAVHIDGLFSAQECQDLVRVASAANQNIWDRALVNTGGGTQAHYPDIRNCGRILYDDTELASVIWQRVKPHFSDILELTIPAGKTPTGLPRRGHKKVATGLNERLRFLRYGPGEFFEQHCDGRYAREAIDGSGEEFSLYTMHLYLNGGSEEGAEEELVGGSTSFFSPFGASGPQKEIRIKPKVGRVLVFEQRGLQHSGEEVLKGVKLTMRTDVMFQQRPLS